MRDKPAERPNLTTKKRSEFTYRSLEGRVFVGPGRVSAISACLVLGSVIV